MCRVDKLLELLWCTVSTAGCEEVVDLVAKASIIRMLHNSHELDDVVAEVLDPGQHVLGELLVGSHTLLGGGDADMGLIHANTGGLLRSRVLELVRLLGRRVPEARIVNGRHGEILCHILDPCRQAVDAVPVRELKGNLVMSVLGIVVHLGSMSLTLTFEL